MRDCLCPYGLTFILWQNYWQTQTTQQSRKTILRRNRASRSNTIGWNWPLFSACLHITSFCADSLLMASLPLEEWEGSCQVALCIHYSTLPARLKLLKCLRFCSTARLAAGANKRIQGQHFRFLIWQTRAGTSLNNPVPTAEKYKAAKRGRGRFSRKAGGKAEGGFKFPAFVVGAESSHRRPHLFRVGEKNPGWKALLYSSAPCTQVPGAEPGSRGNQNVIAIKVYGHEPRFILFITTAKTEPWNRWERMLCKQVRGMGARDFRADCWGSGWRVVIPLSLLQRSSARLIPFNWRQPESPNTFLRTFCF